MTASAIEPTRRSPAEPSRLLDRLDAWPFLRIEHRGAVATLYFCDGDQAIGTIDGRTGMLTVHADREVIAPLLERHPDLQASTCGVRVRATGAGYIAAEALLRWRIDLERFAPQLRDASP
jgi:hypothetical protein